MNEQKMIIREDTIFKPFEYVQPAVVSYKIWGTDANALVISFGRKLNTLSGGMGYRSARVICNCYVPKEVSDYIHLNKRSWRTYLAEVQSAIVAHYGISRNNITVLSTGVNMMDLTQAVERHEDIWVQAWVTAGFKHNAMRIGVDEAGGVERNNRFYPCGTVNIIVITNAKLSLAGMASCFISITEAKTIAFQDMNIRSSFNPSIQATGTGTDQILVVSGEDFRCRFAGGHTKLGELMARAVTRACKEAISKQLAKDPTYHDS